MTDELEVIPADPALVDLNRTPEQAELFKGLIKFQSTVRLVQADASNPHFGSAYATLGAMWEAIRSPLAEAELCLIQEPEASRDGIMLRSTLAHSSGQWRSSLMYIPVSEKQAKNPQAFGSALSYAKRYAAGAILGVATTSEDDDGSSAVDKSGFRNDPLAEEQKGWDSWCDAKVEQLFKVPTPAQLAQMWAAMADEYKRAPENVRKRLDNSKKSADRRLGVDIDPDADVPQ